CAGSGKDPRSTAVAIYVLTGEVPGSGARPAPETGPKLTPDGTSGPDPQPAPPDTESAPQPAEPDPDSEPAADPAAYTRPRPAATIPGAGTGVTLDGAIVPAALLADLIATGAKVRPLSEIADLGTERQYTPSTALAAFVRMSAMTCSFPGCTKPAHR